MEENIIESIWNTYRSMAYILREAQKWKKGDIVDNPKYRTPILSPGEKKMKPAEVVALNIPRAISRIPLTRIESMRRQELVKAVEAARKRNP